MKPNLRFLSSKDFCNIFDFFITFSFYSTLKLKISFFFQSTFLSILSFFLFGKVEPTWMVEPNFRGCKNASFRSHLFWCCCCIQSRGFRNMGGICLPQPTQAAIFWNAIAFLSPIFASGLTLNPSNKRL